MSLFGTTVVYLIFAFEFEKNVQNYLCFKNFIGICQTNLTQKDIFFILFTNIIQGCADNLTTYFLKIHVLLKKALWYINIQLNKDKLYCLFSSFYSFLSYYILLYNFLVQICSYNGFYFIVGMRRFKIFQFWMLKDAEGKNG